MSEKKQVYVAVDKKDKLFYYDGEKYTPVLDETGGGGDVTADDIKSEGIEAGKVLAADGSGGAVWANGGSGGGAELYSYHVAMFLNTTNQEQPLLSDFISTYEVPSNWDFSDIRKIFLGVGKLTEFGLNGTIFNCAVASPANFEVFSTMVTVTADSIIYSSKGTDIELDDTNLNYAFVCTNLKTGEQRVITNAVQPEE